MTDEEIIERLSAAATSLTAVELANLLDELTDGGLSHGTLITYFKRAFPEIPLRVLIEDAGTWARLSEGGIRDEEFNAILSNWLPVRSTE